MTNEEYIGDGVYASLDPARMVVLRTRRSSDGWGLRPEDSGSGVDHWIALEPEVFHELIRFAYSIGWGDIVEVAKPKAPVISDEEYARDEEDQQRKRDAAEGFPDED